MFSLYFDWLLAIIIAYLFNFHWKGNKILILCITDAPSIRLLGAPQIDLEEGKDSLVLRCEADANPPASVVWKRAGRSEIASLQVSEQLTTEKMCNVYVCVC